MTFSKERVEGLYSIMKETGTFELAKERATEMAKEITPGMTTEDILTRGYIQALIDSSCAMASAITSGKIRIPTPEIKAQEVKL